MLRRGREAILLRNQERVSEKEGIKARQQVEPEERDQNPQTKTPMLVNGRRWLSRLDEGRS